jgi:hypothetical protein
LARESRFGPLFPEFTEVESKDSFLFNRSHDGQLRLSWGARSTLSSKKISDLECDMKNVTPLRLGVFGAVWFVGGLGWFAFWMVYVRPPDLPGFSNDVEVPTLPRVIALLGFLVVVAALVWAVRLRNGKARS